MRKVIETLLIALFSYAPILNWVNGYKRVIGNVLTMAGTIVLGLQNVWPELAILQEVNAWIVILAGALSSTVGDLHARAKSVR